MTVRTQETGLPVACWTTSKHHKFSARENLFDWLSQVQSVSKVENIWTGITFTSFRAVYQITPESTGLDLPVAMFVAAELGASWRGCPGVQVVVRSPGGRAHVTSWAKHLECLWSGWKGEQNSGWPQSSCVRSGPPPLPILLGCTRPLAFSYFWLHHSKMVAKYLSPYLKL